MQHEQPPGPNDPVQRFAFLAIFVILGAWLGSTIMGRALKPRLPATPYIRMGTMESTQRENKHETLRWKGTTVGMHGDAQVAAP
jgi:hypothetical protein